jgi:Fic family protein
MKILTDKYLKKYQESLKKFKIKYISFLKNSKNLDFQYLTESSSVFSSNIEWNTLDINSFMNFRMNKNITKDVEEIENLIKSYNFAEKNKLNEKNLLEVHKISSKTLLIKLKRWKYRDDKVWVFWKEWLIYLAIEAEYVKQKMKELFNDIELLINKDLNLEQIFYYASQIHLKFVHIHPFSDWNGRCARLLEKWFLVEKLWKELWKIKSEEYYKENRNKYYENINLWVNYYELNYNNSLNFLLMLVTSLEK